MEKGTGLFIIFIVSGRSGRKYQYLSLSCASMKSPGISIDGVRLTLESHTVFSGLTLEFAANQCHCILGRSGVGKTSLLNLVSGSATAQSGSVSASNGVALATQIAYMLQDDGLLPWLSAIDNVQLGSRLRGTSNPQSIERAMSLLTSVGLADRASSLPATLSGGMRQRVALARALMEDRPVILMDEPFSRLDAITRDELQVMASDLLRERTVILVTHDPAEALRIAHTVTVLHKNAFHIKSTSDDKHADHSITNFKTDKAQPDIQKLSKTTTFILKSDPPRQRNDVQVVELTPALWSALSDDPLPGEVGV